MAKALDGLRPALQNFYSSLSDEQKAQINSLGRQLELWAKDFWGDFLRDAARQLRERQAQRPGSQQEGLKFCYRGILPLGTGGICRRPARPRSARTGESRSALIGAARAACVPSSALAREGREGARTEFLDKLTPSPALPRKRGRAESTPLRDN